MNFKKNNKKQHQQSKRNKRPAVHNLIMRWSQTDSVGDFNMSATDLFFGSEMAKMKRLEAIFHVMITCQISVDCEVRYVHCRFLYTPITPVYWSEFGQIGEKIISFKSVTSVYIITSRRYSFFKVLNMYDRVRRWS